jgi:UDP-2,4-diacetamido-2,4,6-trideoxy-beta-L-altropyranose hydrolase
MYIAIRTDASNQVGSGHFMRCLTLAIELKMQGAQICFVSRSLPQHFIEMLKLENMAYVPLSEGCELDQVDELAHSYWLGTSQAVDAQLTIQALGNQYFDWIVVDHYGLDIRWESAVRICCKKMLVIDDLADRVHDCDVLVDQNYYEDMLTRYVDKVPVNCQLLLGPRYALLRREFLALREQFKRTNGIVKRILVFFGGVDIDNCTGLTIQALAKLKVDQHVDVVVGAKHPNLEYLQQACDANGYFCHVQTANMAELMAEADLAIGAGGSATWERCCLGLPTITFCLAENQRKLITDAATQGLLYAPISCDQTFITVVQHHIKSLLENPSLRKLISQNGQNLVNGLGAQRVASTLGCKLLEINRAINSDSKNIYEWRNHLEVRNVSRNSKSISWDKHQKWFEKALANNNCEILIGSDAQKPIGVVRFDIEEILAEVSIYIVPGSGFHGYGRTLLLSAEKWLKKNRPEVKIIRANVLINNQSSKYLFSSLNYLDGNIDYYKNI